MTFARSDPGDPARTRSLDLLNQHLAAAVILQDRMLQSPRHVRGADFIMVDELCDRIAHLMESCAGEIAGRVADLGGTPHWPVRPVPRGRVAPIIPCDLPDPVRTEPKHAANDGALDLFGQSVLDAVSVAQAYGDGATADMLAQVWRDVDRHLWMTVRIDSIRTLAS